MSYFIDQVARICDDEWNFFDRGKRKEYQKKVYRRIGTYWRQGPKIRGRDGRTKVDFGDLDRDDPEVIVPASRNKNPKWSAAFISWVARRAGAGRCVPLQRFPFTVYSSGPTSHPEAEVKGEVHRDAAHHVYAKGWRPDCLRSVYREKRYLRHGGV